LYTRLLVYGLIGLIAVLAYLFGSVIFATGLGAHAARADYMNFLLGGAMLDQGQANAATLYDISRQAVAQQALIGPFNIGFRDGLLPFVSIPLVALFAAPLYYLPLPVGFILWDVVQLAALLLSLWLLGAMLPAQNRYLLWLGGFAFLPVYASLTLGQVSPTLLLGVTLLWRGLRAGDKGNWWGGVGLALCLLKPQVLPLFLLYLLYRRNWRALGGFASASALVYLLSALISGFAWPVQYASIIAWAGGQRNHYGFDAAVMFNLRGLLGRLNTDNTALLTVLTAIVAAALVYSWWRSEHPPTPTLPPEWGGELDGLPPEWAGDKRDPAGWGRDEREPVGILELQLRTGSAGASRASDEREPVGILELQLRTGSAGASRARDEREPVGILELQLAATTIAAALTSLHLYVHDLTILLFSGAALLGWAARRGWPAWMTALLLASLLTPALTFGSSYDIVILLTIIAALGASLYLLLPRPTQVSRAVLK
jgi:Glycosyltransferase family 87